MKHYELLRSSLQFITTNICFVSHFPPLIQQWISFRKCYIYGVMKWLEWSDRAALAGVQKGAGPLPFPFCSFGIRSKESVKLHDVQSFPWEAILDQSYVKTQQERLKVRCNIKELDISLGNTIAHIHVN